MNSRVRQVFEEKVYPNFRPDSAHGLRRKPTGEYVSDTLEDHWQTFQEGWEYACDEIDRGWVDLTHEEKHQLNDALNLQGRFPIIDTIEAKLREKNGG